MTECTLNNLAPMDTLLLCALAGLFSLIFILLGWAVVNFSMCSISSFREKRLQILIARRTACLKGMKCPIENY